MKINEVKNGLTVNGVIVNVSKNYGDKSMLVSNKMGETKYTYWIKLEGPGVKDCEDRDIINIKDGFFSTTCPKDGIPKVKIYVKSAEVVGKLDAPKPAN